VIQVHSNAPPTREFACPAYTKGRDLYDLLWYLEDLRRPTPNVEMLANALRQSDPEARSIDDGAWPAMVLARLGEVDWAAGRSDVEHFLERPSEAESLTYETYQRLLTARGA
jgi:hypothetical protein